MLRKAPFRAKNYRKKRSNKELRIQVIKRRHTLIYTEDVNERTKTDVYLLEEYFCVLEITPVNYHDHEINKQN